MYEKVLLAYDGSEEGRRALREGARIAQICKSEVVLLAVVDVSSGVFLAEGADLRRHRAGTKIHEEVLAEGVRRLEGHGLFAHRAAGDRRPRPDDRDGGEGDRRRSRRHRPSPAGAARPPVVRSVTIHLVDHLTCSVLVSRKDIPDEMFWGEMQAAGLAAS